MGISLKVSKALSFSNVDEYYWNLYGFVADQQEIASKQNESSFGVKQEILYHCLEEYRFFGLQHRNDKMGFPAHS